MTPQAHQKRKLTCLEYGGEVEEDGIDTSELLEQHQAQSDGERLHVVRQQQVLY